MDNTTEYTIDEFFDLLWEEVSDSIVPTLFLHKNQEFIDTITFDLYRIYSMTKGVTTIGQLARVVESIIGNYLKFGIEL